MMAALRMDRRALLLGDLLDGLVKAEAGANVLVLGVTQDSRQVEPGALFMAMAGQQVHGMAFFDQVVESGAAAVLVEPSDEWNRARLVKLAANAPVPVIKVDGLRRLAGIIAGRFFGEPSLNMRVIGVTGTNGKSSVTHFLAQALGGRVSAGVIGTLGNGVPGHLYAATHTTPDAVSVQAELSRQSQEGIKALAMEVSSHALDQQRVNGVLFHTAVFTNLSRDHQDYHGSMRAYAEAKARLFHGAALMLAVINVDDVMGAGLIEDVSGKVNTIAVGGRSDTSLRGDRFVRALEVIPSDQGLRIQFDSSWGAGEIHSPLLGRFNAENLLLSLAVLLGWDMPLSAALNALDNIQPVPGRMALLGGNKQPRVVVDFAHTPDALEQVLKSLRDHVTGQLICVFGCGGDRDKGKRPMMGDVAHRLADKTILTDDNPRGEDGDKIILDILEGMQADDLVIIERDRAKAIEKAIALATTDDLVLIAGKGHEDYQLVGDLKVPFSDMQQVEKSLQRGAA